MSILEERLNQAFESKKNDINSYIWKGEKKEVNGKYVQSEKRLVDCTKLELQRNYDYCWQMLYNDNVQKPGRYTLLSIIDDQINRCNCELFLRWLKSEGGKDKFVLVSELKRVVDSHKEVIPDLRLVPISSMISGLPDEYSNLPVSMVIEGGQDKLGRFNKQHITLTFILKQGIWLTPEELQKFTVRDEVTGELVDRINLIRKKLAITSEIPLRSTPKGLSFSQLEAMTTLRSKKYSELSLEQLQTLRNRVLFALSDDCRFHISQWENRMKQILAVAEVKGFDIWIPEVQ